jgi:hypothetical protein
VTCRLKAGIVDPEKSSIARKRPQNKFRRQYKQAPALKIFRPSIGNRQLNTSLNNAGILGSCVCLLGNLRVERDATTGEPLQVVFSVRSVRRLRRERQLQRNEWSQWSWVAE